MLGMDFVRMPDEWVVLVKEVLNEFVRVRMWRIGIEQVGLEDNLAWRLTETDVSRAPRSVVRRLVTVACYPMHSLPQERVLRFMLGIEVIENGLTYSAGFHVRKVWREYMASVLSAKSGDLDDPIKRSEFHNSFKRALEHVWDKAARISEAEATVLVF